VDRLEAYTLTLLLKQTSGVPQSHSSSPSIMPLPHKGAIVYGEKTKSKNTKLFGKQIYCGRLYGKNRRISSL